MNVISRDVVYDVVDGERDYQDDRSPESETQGVHTVTEWGSYLASYGLEVLRIGSFTWGEECRIRQLDMIRKLVAMGVSCMEQNGVVARGELEGLLAALKNKD